MASWAGVRFIVTGDDDAIDNDDDEDDDVVNDNDEDGNGVILFELRTKQNKKINQNKIQNTKGQKCIKKPIKIKASAVQRLSGGSGTAFHSTVSTGWHR